MKKIFKKIMLSALAKGSGASFSKKNGTADLFIFIVRFIARLLAPAAVLALLWAAAASTYAADMRDEMVKVTKGSGFFSTKLTTRIYAPRGDGPFPIVVINHGKAPGMASMQKDRGFYPQALEFVKRGYIVVVPTRSGFGSSGGGYISNCSLESMGYAHADDVEAAINYAKALPYADSHHIVVLGQSQGGLATLALGARNVNGVVGVINTSGGMFNPSCTGDNGFFALMAAFKSFGEMAKVPALFMYGRPMSTFPVTGRRDCSKPTRPKVVGRSISTPGPSMAIRTFCSTDRRVFRSGCR